MLTFSVRMAQDRSLRNLIVLCRHVPLLSRVYFAHSISPPDTSEQLIYFSNLVRPGIYGIYLPIVGYAQGQVAGEKLHAAQVQWLLGLAQLPCSLSGSFADAQQLCRSIVGDVTAAGLQDLQVTEADIRPGWGAAVCHVLNRLADAALEHEAATWERIIHRADV
jgi:hypothetical protein